MSVGDGLNRPGVCEAHRVGLPGQPRQADHRQARTEHCSW